MKKRIMIIIAVCLLSVLAALAIMIRGGYIKPVPAITAGNPAQATDAGNAEVTDGPAATEQPHTAAPVETAPADETESGAGNETLEYNGDELPEDSLAPEVAQLMNSNGSIGTLSIPSINVNVQIFEGTDTATLDKGAGHFGNASVWTGNVCIAGVRPDRA